MIKKTTEYQINNQDKKYIHIHILKVETKVEWGQQGGGCANREMIFQQQHLLCSAIRNEKYV